MIFDINRKNTEAKTGKEMMVVIQAAGFDQDQPPKPPPPRPIPPEPERPTPQPPWPQIPPTGPEEPHVPTPDPEPLPTPTPGPIDLARLDIHAPGNPQLPFRHLHPESCLKGFDAWTHRPLALRKSFETNATHATLTTRSDSWADHAKQ